MVWRIFRQIGVRFLVKKYAEIGIKKPHQFSLTEENMCIYVTDESGALSLAISTWIGAEVKMRAVGACCAAPLPPLPRLSHLPLPPLQQEQIVHFNMNHWMYLCWPPAFEYLDLKLVASDLIYLYNLPVSGTGCIWWPLPVTAWACLDINLVASDPYLLVYVLCLYLELGVSGGLCTYLDVPVVASTCTCLGVS